MTLKEAKARIAELEQRVQELENEDARERVRELEQELDEAHDPGDVLANRLRELLAGLTLFPERDCPEFYDALDAYDVARARQG
jgi:hypothetical protein